MFAYPRSRSALVKLLRNDAIGGIILMAASLLALVVANSPLDHLYHDLLHLEMGGTLSQSIGPMTAHLWINDALMALFFLLVGLEIKREMLDGRLATARQRILPFLAAAAGMAVPAAIYLLMAGTDASLVRGWAIPAATDIAFALGVLALLGPRAPTSLKLFLTTVAIVDDMGAVAIIALFYTSELNLVALGAAATILAFLFAMNRLGVRRLPFYLIGAALLWYAILLSGVHATIAGVLAALTIPIVKTPGAPDSDTSPLHRLEHSISPFVSFLILPLFGFANAGLSLQGIGLAQMSAPLPLGIAAGLLIGKQIGIFGSIWIAVKLGLASRLRGTSWLQIYGLSLLCGIGFTMSLFIGALAFPGRPDLIEQAKLGVLAGSFLSALAGYFILRIAALSQTAHEEDEMRAEIRADGDVENM